MVLFGQHGLEKARREDNDMKCAHRGEEREGREGER